MGMVVIEIPHSETINSPPLFLEDELLRVWGRIPDITYITESEIEGYTSMETLCSYTIAGSDQDDEVVRLREKACAY